MKLKLTGDQANQLFNFILQQEIDEAVNLEFKFHNSGEGLYVWTDPNEDQPTWIAGPEAKV